MSRRRSRTAEIAAALRAIGHLERDPDLRNPDGFAVRLIGPALRPVVRLPPLRAGLLRIVERLSPGAYHFLTARTRHVDHILLDEVHKGLTQVVILGAGADSRAYRFADELAGVTVFELDHPLTSAWKQGRVRRALRRLPEHVRYVGVDLGVDRLDDALAVTDRQAPIFFVWEGVTPYLDMQAVAATLASIGRCAPGSSIVFDYFARPEPERAERYLRRIGEPWLSEITPDEVGSIVAPHGLALVSNVVGPELADRYLGGKAAISRGWGVAHAWRTG